MQFREFHRSIVRRVHSAAEFGLRIKVKPVPLFVVLSLEHENLPPLGELHVPAQAVAVEPDALARKVWREAPLLTFGLSVILNELLAEAGEIGGSFARRGPLSRWLLNILLLKRFHNLLRNGPASSKEQSQVADR